MNRVTVSLVAYGPYVLDFRCGANNYIDVVEICRERLIRLGYAPDVKFCVNVW